MLATQHITINPPYNKNNLWIMTTCNRWYNIGIKPYMDYINHGNNNHISIIPMYL